MIQRSGRKSCAEYQHCRSAIRQVTDVDGSLAVAVWYLSTSAMYRNLLIGEYILEYWAVSRYRHLDRHPRCALVPTRDVIPVSGTEYVGTRLAVVNIAQPMRKSSGTAGS